jgi:hypothetical protein
MSGTIAQNKAALASTLSLVRRRATTHSRSIGSTRTIDHTWQNVYESDGRIGVLTAPPRAVYSTKYRYEKKALFGS